MGVSTVGIRISDGGREALSRWEGWLDPANPFFFPYDPTQTPSFPISTDTVPAAQTPTPGGLPPCLLSSPTLS